MRHFEIQQPPTPEPRPVLVKVTCDLCAKEHDGNSDWSSDTFDVEEIQVSRTHGNSFPEGCDVEFERFEVCPQCWTEKVVPWFKSQGAKPETGVGYAP